MKNVMIFLNVNIEIDTFVTHREATGRVLGVRDGQDVGLLYCN